MTRFPLHAVCVGALMISATPVFAQSQEPVAGATVRTAIGPDLEEVDVMSAAKGYRASALIGTEVYNEAGDSIGEIDDLVVQPDQKVVYAIISVGGFLGIGDSMVAVPYTALRIDAEGDVMLPAVTKEQLKAAPEFRYAE